MNVNVLFVGRDGEGAEFHIVKWKSVSRVYEESGFEIGNLAMKILFSTGWSGWFSLKTRYYVLCHKIIMRTGITTVRTLIGMTFIGN